MQLWNTTGVFLLLLYYFYQYVAFQTNHLFLLHIVLCIANRGLIINITHSFYYIIGWWIFEGILPSRLLAVADMYYYFSFLTFQKSRNFEYLSNLYNNTKYNAKINSNWILCFKIAKKDRKCEIFTRIWITIFWRNKSIGKWVFVVRDTCHKTEKVVWKKYRAYLYVIVQNSYRNSRTKQLTNKLSSNVQLFCFYILVIIILLISNTEFKTILPSCYCQISTKLLFLVLCLMNLLSF